MKVSLIVLLNLLATNLEHYMQCPHLLTLWTFLAGDISSDPLVRWGLIEPEPNELLQIACVVFPDTTQLGGSSNGNQKCLSIM